MISKELIFNTLILLSIISFGVVGSLSHVFNLVIIFMLGLHFLNNRNKMQLKTNSKILFFALSSIFFIFLIRGIFHDDTWSSIESLSPMLPIPIIGLMILLTNNDGLNIEARTLAKFSKIAVCIIFIVYLLFSNGLADRYDLKQHFIGRLEMFSGNPIPFSTAVFGITVFCFSNWQSSNSFERLITLACCIIGFWLAGVLSGSRGSLLAIMISLPYLLWFTTKSLSMSFLIIIFISVTSWLLLFSGLNFTDGYYVTRLSNGFETLFTDQKTDNAMQHRLEMWVASIKTIKDNPFLGYDISNRFVAIKTNLLETFEYKFTHPHNDILASTIGVGLIGFILSIVSLLSPVFGAILSEVKTQQKMFLGTLVTLGVLVTASVNTIFFNDITSAWLAFSTFLIWNIKFTKQNL